uniref:Mitochondrial ribosomal protein of the small subunit n=1 Tax=Panagrellus redivivus TaxID=6233 RepID=A0A7E4UMW0_PANRE
MLRFLSYAKYRPSLRGIVRPICAKQPTVSPVTLYDFVEATYPQNTYVAHDNKAKTTDSLLGLLPIKKS